MLPAKCPKCFSGVPLKEIDFCRTEITRIDLDKHAAAPFVNPAFVFPRPLPHNGNANFGEGPLDELSYRMGLSRSQNIIVRLWLLHYPPHTFDEIARVSPIAACIQISQKELFLQTQMDRSNGAGDFSCYKCLCPARTFVIEQDSIRGVYPVGFAIIYGNPVGVELCGCIGRTGIKWRCLVLRHGLRLAVKLRR